MLLHEYPYTNFHEINLDYLLTSINKCVNTVSFPTPTKIELTYVDGTTNVIDNIYLASQLVNIINDITDIKARLEALEGNKNEDNLL